MINLKYLPICLLLSVSLVCITGCKKDEPSLSLPPISTFKMDFGNFSTTKSASTTQTKVNYTLASFTVGFWSIIAGVQTLVPAAAFSRALENTPTLNNETKTWEWVYETKVGTDTYKSYLTGKIINDSVQWKMYLSRVGSSLINYLWFEGMSAQSATGGWWALNYPRASSGGIISGPGLKINWTHTNSNVLSLKYVYVAETVFDEGTNKLIPNPNLGAYIEFKKFEDPLFNSSFSIFSKKENKLTDIIWNSETRDGKIIVNQQPVGCWDKHLFDSNCK